MNRRKTTRVAARLRLIVGVAVIGLLCNREYLGTNDDNDNDETSPQDGHDNHRSRKHQRAAAARRAVRPGEQSAEADRRHNQRGEKDRGSDDGRAAGGFASPVTIGEHVGLAETNIAAIQKNLSDNLGISVHALVDAGYEHNFNQPNGNVNVYREWDEDGFQLTQGNLHIERDGTVGFVTDLNFGQVANSISTVTHYSNTSHVGPGWFDPTQYYLTYTAPIGSGVSLQAGRFVTLLGAGDSSGFQRPKLQREPRPALYPGRTNRSYRHPRQLHVQRLRVGHGRV